MRSVCPRAEIPAGNLCRLYGFAFLISFAGSLPVGTLNVSITNLVIDRHVGGAISFGMGAVLVEVGMVRLALVAVKRLEGISRFLRWFRVIACVVILLFAFLSLDAAWHLRKAGVPILFTGDAPFVSGLVLSLLNPLHLPFWMGWTSVLRSKGLLAHTRKEYNVYVLAIGMGTCTAFLVYGITGHLLILFLRANQNLFNWLTGIALLVAGLAQGWKIRRGISSPAAG
jgi:LysE type translocator